MQTQSFDNERWEEVLPKLKPFFSEYFQKDDFMIRGVLATPFLHFHNESLIVIEKISDYEMRARNADGSKPFSFVWDCLYGPTKLETTN